MDEWYWPDFNSPAALHAFFFFLQNISTSSELHDQGSCVITSEEFIHIN